MRSDPVKCRSGRRKRETGGPAGERRRHARRGGRREPEARARRLGGEKEALARHGRAPRSPRRGVDAEEVTRALRFAVGLFLAVTGGAMALEVRSAAFAEGGSIPPQYTCDGKNVSPPLSWSGIP